MRRALLLLLATTLALAGCEKESGHKSIKLAHGLNQVHPVHKAMVHLAERVKEKSNGQLTIEIYSSGQLGTERECLELLQIGSLGMTKVSSAVMEAFSPSYKVFGLPYIFETDAQRWAVMNGPIGQEILTAGEPFFLRGLCYYDAGYRSFYTTHKPIRTPDDLAGMKIRVQESPVAFKLVQTLGASPTPISWGELYTSLQQGIVDGAENNPPSFQTSKHYEVCKFYSLNEHTAVPDVLLIGTKVWNNLTPQQQQWLQQAADESAEYERKLWEQSTEEAMSIFEAAGVEIIRPDKRPFIDKVRGMENELFGNDPAVYNLIQRIHAVKGEQP